MAEGRGDSPEKQSLVLGCGDGPLAPVESVGLCLAELRLEAGWAEAPQLPLAGAARTYRLRGINRIKF